MILKPEVGYQIRQSIEPKQRAKKQPMNTPTPTPDDAAASKLATPRPWSYGNGAIWADCNGEGNSPTEVCSYVSEADGNLICAAVNRHAPTPKVDAMAVTFYGRDEDGERLTTQQAVPLEDARQLERELVALQSRAENAERERDDYRDAVVRCSAEIAKLEELRNGDGEIMERMRDTLRACADPSGGILSMSPEHIMAHVSHLRADLTAARADVEQARRERDDQASVIRKCWDALGSHDEAGCAPWEAITALRAEVAQLKEQLKEAKKEHENLAAARSQYVEELREQLALFERNEGSLLAQLTALQTKADALAGALEKSRDEHRAQAKLWASINDSENADYHKKQADEEDVALADYRASTPAKPDPAEAAIAAMSPGVRNVVECLAGELVKSVGREIIQNRFIATPATCVKCHSGFHASTTAKMLNSCPDCGGELKTDPKRTPAKPDGEDKLKKETKL